MSLLPIVQWPDERLSAACDPIDEITAKIIALAEDMLETMYAAPGRGLAAPQVGVLNRLFVMDTSWKEGECSPQVFVNPEISWRSNGKTAMAEGCLSIPGVSVEVERSERVRLGWTGLNGEYQQAEFDGFAAVCIQHEIDHLDGVVTLDRVDIETRTSLIAEYAGGTV